MHRLQHIATAAAGNVNDAHGLARPMRLEHGRFKQGLEMHAALPNAAPADAAQVILVNHPPQRREPARSILIHVIKRRTRIETALPAEPDALAERADVLKEPARGGKDRTARSTQ